MLDTVQIGNFFDELGQAVKLPVDFLNQKLPFIKKENLNALYACGYHYYENGKYESALDVFRFLTKMDVTQMKYWKGLGACFQLLRNYHDALEAYSRAAILNPLDIDLHLNAADCCFATGQIERGHQALDAVEQLANQKEEHEHFLEKLELLKQVWPLEK